MAEPNQTETFYLLFHSKYSPARKWFHSKSRKTNHCHKLGKYLKFPFLHKLRIYRYLMIETCVESNKRYSVIRLEIISKDKAVILYWVHCSAGWPWSSAPDEIYQTTNLYRSRNSQHCDDNFTLAPHNTTQLENPTSNRTQPDSMKYIVDRRSYSSLVVFLCLQSL